MNAGNSSSGGSEGDKLGAFCARYEYECMLYLYTMVFGVFGMTTAYAYCLGICGDFRCCMHCAMS